jgi:hypothetical protein
MFAAHMDRAREHIRPWVGAGFVNDPAAAVLDRYANATAADGARIVGIWDEGVLRAAWKVGDSVHDTQVWSVLSTEWPS